MRKTLAVLATSGTFLLLPVTAAHAQDTGVQTSVTTQSASTTMDDEGDKTGLWGLLGLLGLAGLAKRRVADGHDAGNRR